ncbi:MAG: hypothetical protein DME00_24990 [Candidatus Rokuibacteriota bacterium]|nr:MAG: hypothetical protein DME00_24990 [Candidatus Rokubacteria bacterium]
MAALVCQEHVCAPVLALEPTLETARRRRQGCEIGIVGDVHHQVDVFRAWAVAYDRTDERDTSNP